MKDNGEHTTTLMHISIVCPHAPGLSYFTFYPPEKNWSYVKESIYSL